MLVRAKKDVQSPGVVHDSLQASDTFVLDLLVFPSPFALAQCIHNFVDAGLSEFLDPTDRVARECDSKTFDALMDLCRTSVSFLEVVNVIARLLKA